MAAPHRFVGHEAIARTNTGDWQPHAISTIQVPDGLYGPGGSSAETRDGSATIKLAAGKVSLVELYYLAQPHGGVATITGDGKPVSRTETSGDTKQPGCAATRPMEPCSRYDAVQWAWSRLSPPRVSSSSASFMALVKLAEVAPPMWPGCVVAMASASKIAGGDT